MTNDTSATRSGEDPNTLGTRLRESREYLHLTQADVAEALGIPRTAVIAIEAGTRKVAAGELQRLSRLYRRTVTWLLGEDEPVSENDVQALFRVAEGLTETDRAQVLEFARFLAGRPRPADRQP